MGDHTECIQVDYDPAQVSYEDLLDTFFEMHNATRRAYSTQYASLVLTTDEAQDAAAAEAMRRWSEALGAPLFTDVRPLDRFYVAEDYHQKYGLRSDSELMGEFSAMYADPAQFRESTAAARVNGYVYSGGNLRQLESEIESLGLSRTGRERLRDIASRRF